MAIFFKASIAFEAFSSWINPTIPFTKTTTKIIIASAVSLSTKDIIPDINKTYIKTSLNRANSISSDMMEIQNGYNDDLLSTVKSIESKMDDDSGNVYNINGITYSDNDNVQKAVEDLIRAIKIDKRRI